VLLSRRDSVLISALVLLWVAALMAFVLLEKIGPAGVIVARAAGAAMILLVVVEIVR